MKLWLYRSIYSTCTWLDIACTLLKWGLSCYQWLLLNDWLSSYCWNGFLNHAGSDSNSTRPWNRNWTFNGRDEKYEPHKHKLTSSKVNLAYLDFKLTQHLTKNKIHWTPWELILWPLTTINKTARCLIKQHENNLLPLGALWKGERDEPAGGWCCGQVFPAAPAISPLCLHLPLPLLLLLLVFPFAFAFSRQSGWKIFTVAPDACAVCVFFF